MKAVVLHEYGPPSRLKYEDFPDPRPGPGEVLVSVQAASLNPVDWKMRSGAAKDHFPVAFPGVLGRDVAGLVRELGEGVQGFAVGDRVLALAWATYAELCVVKASDLAKIPSGLEMTTAAAVPLVSLTGDQLIRRATEVQPGQTIILTGATGSVGRCALFAALELGARVVAGVRKKQMEEARQLGAFEAIDLDDDEAIARVGTMDAVADTVGGEVASKLLGKVKPGGNYGSVLGPPKDAALHPTVNIRPMTAQPDPATILHYAEAVRDGRLKLPIECVMPLREAAEAHALAEKGGIGKVILTP
ncbi:MAG TPA: NADP-dependent oxidoreductase [Acidobacteriaceae bacterium]|jgi:NADPH:quinone reductase-like Zn-dependent oxidoreductase|nr:NADP-dependent oxidoreductase [Acidobacteriaceae bacterium]